MDKFIVNIIHRPEMVPEYSATVTGQGKEEDIGDKKLITESLDIFKTQQRLAHEAGLKTTIQMTYASLFNDEAVELAKQDHEKYGDEIALSLLGLPCEEFREKYKTKDFCIWIISSACVCCNSSFFVVFRFPHIAILSPPVLFCPVQDIP